MAQALTDKQLLMIWERGYGRPPYEQALVALAEACPDVPLAAISAWPIGERDQQMLQLRGRAFGGGIETVTNCPSCDKPLESKFDVDDLCAEPSASATSTTASVVVGEYAMVFRPPNSDDLAALSRVQVDRRPQRLLEFCLISAARDNQPIEAAELPFAVLEDLQTSITNADPRAEIQLASTCPACGHAWSMRFDVVSFFWMELNAWAQRMLAEIHLLASAYGWAEHEILALSPWRRQVYLEMVRS